MQVLETCVKNCGHRFHVQVANRDFIDGVMVKIISPKNNPPTIVQDKVLSLIQVSWRLLPFIPLCCCCFIFIEDAKNPTVIPLSLKVGFINGVKQVSRVLW